MEDGENSPTPNPAPLPPSPPSQDGGVGGSGAGTGTGAGTSQRPSTRVWTRETVPTNLWLPDTVLRMSSCEVEVDGIFSDILNRLQIGGEAGWDTVSQVICLCLCLFFISASFSVSLSNLHFCVWVCWVLSVAPYVSHCYFFNIQKETVWASQLRNISYKPHYPYISVLFFPYSEIQQ